MLFPSIIQLLYLAVLFALVGFITWLLTEKVPMPDIFKVTFQVMMAFLLILYLIGLLSGKIPVPPLPLR